MICSACISSHGNIEVSLFNPLCRGKERSKRVKREEIGTDVAPDVLGKLQACHDTNAPQSLHHDSVPDRSPNRADCKFDC